MKNCNYCSKKKPKDWDARWVPAWLGKIEFRNDAMMNTFALYIKGNELHADYDAYSVDSSFNDSVTINYCPMCGKKLNKE